MQSYELTEEAVRDLREVARYTLNRWGKEILQQYREGLKETFKAIASNNVPKRTFSRAFPDLLVAKYRYHYIF
jgi:plasmid stabilization system protein ParE